MSSIVVSGDTSGAVTLSAPAVAGTVTVTLPSTSGTMLTTASTTGISGSAISSGTVPEAYGGTGTSTGYYGFKNRIINGAMVIDQRNAGAVINPAVNNTYCLDRWNTNTSNPSVYKVQQNAGSITPPAGFSNYLGVTSITSYTVTSTDSFSLIQKIEGYNIADLAWGTANAQTVTLSAWVYSSLTGTFGGSITNSAIDRSYPFTYSIPVANTWTKITVTIAGDTSGTWLTTNGLGIWVWFGLGMGPTYSGTAGSWSANSYRSATGAISVVGTNTATFYITGVQLEKGSTATAFDYRPYGTELQLCQRYYYKLSATATNTSYGIGQCFSTTQAGGTTFFPVTMRTSPTALEQTGTASDYRLLNASGSGYACTAVPTFNSGSASTANTVFTTSAVLAAGDATTLTTQSLSSYLAWSAEL